ncbi:hypothetical protein ACIG63_06090 [Streptomyces antimycoticus]|uniref:hypothetical protein n=1 Tax=Streptomyces antimycoticus TaxID=68175 RepID=UPI0037CFC504
MQTKACLKTFVTVTGLTALCVAPVSVSATLMVLAVGSILSHVVRVLLPARKTKVVRDRAAAEFQLAYRQWEARVIAHDQMERARQASAMLWHPVHLGSRPGRVDVFGGTCDGWASMLTTFGTSLMRSGCQVMVLDFSEEHIAGGMERLVTAHGLVTHFELPAEVHRFNVLLGLEADELADMLSQALHTIRRSEGQMDARVLDTDLLQTVTGLLDGQPTFRRLVAGLEVLRRTYDLSAEGLLTAAEITRLTARVDTIGQTEHVQRELQFLISSLNLLAWEERGGTPQVDITKQARSLWQPASLTVVTTSHSQHHRKHLLDHVVFQRLLHDMRHRSSNSEGNVLVVAGADNLGLENVEALAKQCRRIGVRLILFIERLRGDLKELLGSSDSAAILMRLGNAQDAAAAAEFIGRGHKMVLSQLTDQVGRTFSTSVGYSSGHSDSTSWTKGSTVTKGTSETRGTSDSEGTSESTGTSDTEGTSQTWGTSKSASTNFSRSKNKSVTDARTRSWQDTANVSLADNTGHSSTQARVYEFTVEPTTIQALPTTAFLLVESSSAGRRIVLGDCNPGIVLLDHVAGPFPTSSAGSTSCPPPCGSSHRSRARPEVGSPNTARPRGSLWTRLVDAFHGRDAAAPTPSAAPNSLERRDDPDTET